MKYAIGEIKKGDIKSPFTMLEQVGRIIKHHPCAGRYQTIRKDVNALFLPIIFRLK